MERIHPPKKKSHRLLAVWKEEARRHTSCGTFANWGGFLMISVPQKASGDSFIFLISLQGNKTCYDCWAKFCFKSESNIS